MNAVFDVDKGKVMRSFAAASLSYDGFAHLQRTVGRSLLNCIEVERLTGILLDLGCGTGFLSGELLVAAGDIQIIALDIALPMLKMARTKLISNTNVGFVCADAESLPVAASRIDQVCSNLALQWCRNLEVAFTDIHRVLRPGGQFIFTTFGPQTLQELKTAWAEVDDYQHVNEFYDEAQLRYFLQCAGFSEIAITSKVYNSTYSSVMALMQELKHIGAHNVTVGRNKQLTTKAQMQAMMGAYEKHDSSGLVFATYEVITVLARA
jgi:malonyl-CoA O-methyltransferase